MTPAEATMVILSTLTPYYGDHEEPVDRTARLEMIASSIDTAARYGACEKGDPECDDRAWVVGEGTIKRLELTAALIVVGRFESGYALHVHQNKCRVLIGECDSGRARSPWQFQRTDLTRKIWWEYKGADQRSTETAAYAASIVLGRARQNCGSWEGAFSQYATGGGCRWKYAAPRALSYEKTLLELRRLVLLPTPPVVLTPDEDDDDDDQADEDEEETSE